MNPVAQRLEFWIGDRERLTWMVIEHTEGVAQVLKAEAVIFVSGEAIKIRDVESGGECVDVDEVAWFGTTEESQQFVTSEIFGSEDPTLWGGHRRIRAAGNSDVDTQLVVTVVDEEAHEFRTGSFRGDAETLLLESGACRRSENAYINVGRREEVQVRGGTVDDAVNDERTTAGQSHCVGLGQHRDDAANTLLQRRQHSVRQSARGRATSRPSVLARAVRATCRTTSPRAA